MIVTFKVRFQTESKQVKIIKLVKLDVREKHNAWGLLIDYLENKHELEVVCSIKIHSIKEN